MKVLQSPNNFLTIKGDFYSTEKINKGDERMETTLCDLGLLLGIIVSLCVIIALPRKKVIVDNSMFMDTE